MQKENIRDIISLHKVRFNIIDLSSSMILHAMWREGECWENEADIADMWDIVHVVSRKMNSSKSYYEA